MLVACHSSPLVPEEPAVLLAAFRNLLGQLQQQPCCVVYISERCSGHLLGTAVGALDEGAVGQILLQPNNIEPVRAKAAANTLQHYPFPKEDPFVC